MFAVVVIARLNRLVRRIAMNSQVGQPTRCRFYDEPLTDKVASILA
jgi:hypothetical protein